MKRLLTFLILSAFSMATFGGVVSAAEVKSFTDIDWSNENYQAVEYLRSEGILEGYADGTIKPKSDINRAEFLKIVMLAADEEISAEVLSKDLFPDVSEDDWFYGYVNRASELGYVNGYDDGYFRPEQKINFAEASKIIVNVLGLDPSGFADDVWYSKYVKTLEADLAIPKTIVAFDKDVTRGEMAEIIWRVKEKPEGKGYLTYDLIEKAQQSAANDNQLVTFDSCTELQDYVSANTQYYRYDEIAYDSPAVSSPDKSSGAAPEATSELGGGADAGDYSQTNIQVAGVDEADVVKNDGKYIYLVKGDTVRIVQAYPPEDMVELDSITFGDEWFTPSEIYVDGDKMVVVGNDYKNIYYEEPGRGVEQSLPTDGYYYNYSSLTKAYILNISDRSNVKVDRWLSFEGNYSNSRKVGDMLYLVVNKSNYAPFIENDQWYENDVVVPLYYDSKRGKVGKVADCTQILHYPPGENTDYLTVVGIDTSNADSQISKEVILGSSGEIYASRDNLYVTEASYNWWWGPQDKEETVIHKFALGERVNYEGKGAVPGTILDQFSMDEYDGNFRIATTLGSVFDDERPSTNNVYILDQDLEQIGDIEGIAPGEKIYSVRFVDGRMYMVTFKKVDPFFVIDVADPRNPKILGKLKIPGYSDYLHPYDENHIIGFGKEAVTDDFDVEARGLDFAWYQGMKVAMFDVTDVANPVELHKTEIGDRGTDSPLLWDHKALLFDKAKGLMSFPVTVYEIPENVKNDPETPSNTYGEAVFQGAYVYDVSLSNGFALKGKVSHYSDNEVAEKSGTYWWGDKDISRVLYIGNYLYTVSNALVQSNALSNLAEISEVELVEMN